MSATIARPREDRFAHQRHVLELSAVALTAACHLGFQFLDLPRGLFTLPVVVGWLGYAGWRARTDPSALRAWGFRMDNARELAPVLLGFSLVAAIAMALVGAVQGTLALPWFVVLALGFYPLWGVVQQWLLQAFVAENLRRIPGRLGSPAVVTLLTSLLFGLVHWPYPVLMGATFLLGLVFTPLWSKYPNNWLFGLAHGWLGTLVFYWVLNRHPVMDFFLGA